jgi:hypothetical protein
VKIALVVVGVAVMAALTAARVGVWCDDQRLWQEAVRVSPLKPRPLVNLATVYARTAPDLADETWIQARELSLRRSLEERRITDRLTTINRERLHVDLVAWLNAP